MNATTRALQELQRRGVPIIDLTNSNPTTVGLSYPADLLQPLASPAALRYDPQPLGMWSAREAVSEDFARRGLNVPPERVVLTASTSEAYSWLFKLLCDPGDAVLVPQPSYPLFEHLTELESVVARPYRLEYHGTWRIDLEQLRQAAAGDVRAVLVVTPNNPTGSFLHRDDLAVLDRLCADRDLLLIGDEVFADFVLDDQEGRVSVLDAREATVCSLGGLSKSIGLPQVKLGWIGFGGPSQRVDRLMTVLELIADTYLSVSTPVQLALPQLFASGGAIRTQIQQRIARNLHVLRRYAAKTPSISLLPVDGGWSAVLRVPAYESEEAMVLELLTRDHVLVHPGYFFDFEREAFLVVSLLVEPSAFDAGVERVLARVTQMGGTS